MRNLTRSSSPQKTPLALRPLQLIHLSTFSCLPEPPALADNGR